MFDPEATSMQLLQVSSKGSPEQYILPERGFEFPESPLHAALPPHIDVESHAQFTGFVHPPLPSHWPLQENVPFVEANRLKTPLFPVAHCFALPVQNPVPPENFFSNVVPAEYFAHDG